MMIEFCKISRLDCNGYEAKFKIIEFSEIGLSYCNGYGTKI